SSGAAARNTLTRCPARLRCRATTNPSPPLPPFPHTTTTRAPRRPHPPLRRPPPRTLHQRPTRNPQIPDRPLIHPPHLIRRKNRPHLYTPTKPSESVGRSKMARCEAPTSDDRDVGRPRRRE